MTTPLISWKEWEDTYKPINDTMFDFYHEAVDLVKDKVDSGLYIWTVVDNNPNSVYLDVLPGRRYFNSIGFFVTQERWEDLDMVVSNDKSYY